MADTFTLDFKSNASTSSYVDICYHYSYFEVFGLSPDEFDELCKYYDQKAKEN